ncbi:RNA-directed DNA polymerase [Exiguobacterium undae]|uniref:RNA-directed DNA polymerase n=1 Tax=Exiguobacterium undae TaxID=169177 RepID=UPI00047E1465|nr:RNA-directed DNA polymerase [Exiguobacterium undae]
MTLVISAKKIRYQKYFSMEYLLKYGYFDFKYSSSKINQEYLLSNLVYKKIFNTEGVSKIYVDLKLKYGVNFNSRKVTYPVELSIFKNDDERRSIKFPNMYSYICLCEHLNQEQNIYMEILYNSKQSLSNRFYSETFLGGKIKKSKNRFGKRKIFKTDIQHFYPSIYTHSIPWILVGKTEAKNNKNDKSLYYNKLDDLIQRCQIGETHGLPTGSFASKLIAEIYMCKLDEKLSSHKYVRYVDDFEIPYNDVVEKDSFYKHLSKELTNLNLKIKVEKNEIDSFPFQDGNNSAFFFDYFTNITVGISNQRKRIYNFIEESINKEREGHKGSIKLMFRALIDSVKKGILDEEAFNKSIHSNLFNLVLMQPILAVLYIEFLEHFQDNDQAVLSIESNKEEIQINIENYIEMNYNQELFSLLSIFHYLKLQELIPKETLNNIIEQMDDLSASLSFEALLVNEDNIDNDLFEILENRLVNSNSWEDEYWFFKYHIISSIYADKRKKLYRAFTEFLFTKYGNAGETTKDKFLNVKNLSKVKSPINRFWQSTNKENDKDIKKFFEAMLSEKVSFIKS